MWLTITAAALLLLGVATAARKALGKGILVSAGKKPYVLTQQDLDMLARSVYYETRTHPEGMAAVVYALANHYLRVPGKRELHYPTLAAFTARYSTPLHDPGKRNQDVATLPGEVRAAVRSFAAGTLRNPIGARTDWRASWAGYNPADAVNVGGNVFGTNERATGSAVTVL